MPPELKTVAIGVIVAALGIFNLLQEWRIPESGQWRPSPGRRLQQHDGPEEQSTLVQPQDAQDPLPLLKEPSLWLAQNGSQRLKEPALVSVHDDSEHGPGDRPQPQEEWVVEGGDAVLSTLSEASSPEQRSRCLKPPCREGNHIFMDGWSDFGEEMARVKGAVVVRRPDLIAPDNIAPANSLDFAKTLQSYFVIFRDSLFPRSLFPSMLDGDDTEPHQVTKAKSFLAAVRDGDTTAGKYLSAYYADAVVPKPASGGYESAPTVVGMSDVFINNVGHFWNEKDAILQNNCKMDLINPSKSFQLPAGARSYDKVFVLGSMWGNAYYHFVVESLPRIMTMLDVLVEHPDIKIAVSAAGNHNSAEYMYQFLELVGMDRERIIFTHPPIFASLAIIPDSMRCSRPNTVMVNLLRNVLLQHMYPTSRGVPPAPPQPTIVLIVRHSRRQLRNNDEVRDALAENFKDYDVIEFVGNGTILSQLQTFATASVIVAPHGAGLSNIVVSPLHTPVLEIGPAGCPTCYTNLSIKMQMVYARHASTGSWKEHCPGFYEPEPSEVVSLVRDLLEAKRQADAADPPAS